MEIWLAVLIPVIVAIFFLWFFHKQIVWWEIILPFAATILLIIIFKLIGTSSVTKDYEYWGNYVTEVRYYEPWDEYIHQTCSSTCCCDDKGNNCTTTYYDCSYVVNHSAEWVAVFNSGETENISQERYIKLKSQFNNSSFVDMDRNYHSYDGDMYKSIWKGNYEAFEFIASKTSYTNKVQASHSVFNFPEVKPEMVKKYELYDYTEIQNWNKLNTILGYKGYVHNKETDKKFDYINGLFGRSKEIRVWVLLFKNKPRNIAFMQEGYWKGGNKNELNICIGLDNSNKITWCHIFSWTESQAMKVRTRHFVEDMDKLNLNSLADYLFENIPKNWKRKHFSDFDYLTIETPTWAIITTYILVFLASIGINIWSIKNEFSNDENDNDWLDNLINKFKKLKSNGRSNPKMEN